MNQANPYAAPSAAAFTAAPEHGVLREMPTKQVKRLFSYSSTIRAMSVLWAIGVVIELIAAGVLASQGQYLFAAFYVVVAGIQTPASIGCFTRKTWGRTWGIVLSCIGLIGFPIGTLISILVLIALTKGAALFGPDAIAHADLKAEVKYRKKNPGV